MHIETRKRPSRPVRMRLPDRSGFAGSPKSRDSGYTTSFLIRRGSRRQRYSDINAVCDTVIAG
ncbi:hypothetical protein BS17DRAFT_788410 [Gyrodon lividus]|nr:hypothetical protein BS17DRAFT_788410 [Gyrodon lividus]